MQHFELFSKEWIFICCWQSFVSLARFLEVIHSRHMSDNFWNIWEPILWWEGDQASSHAWCPAPLKKLLPHYTQGCEKLLVKRFAALGVKQSTLPVSVDYLFFCGAAWQAQHNANEWLLLRTLEFFLAYGVTFSSDLPANQIQFLRTLAVGYCWDDRYCRGIAL